VEAAKAAYLASTAAHREMVATMAEESAAKSQHILELTDAVRPAALCKR
jgi:hypothetical protein